MTASEPPEESARRPQLRQRRRQHHQATTVSGKRVWSLRRRVTVLLATVSVVLVTLVTTITVSALQARDSMLGQVEELGPARVAVQQMMAAHLNADTGVQVYVDTENEEYLELYHEGIQNQQDSIAELREVAGDQEEISASLDAVAEAAEAWETDFAQPAIDSVAEGAELDQDDYQLGRDRYNDLRSAAQQARDDILTEIDDAQDSLRLATQQLIALLVLAGVLIVVLSIFLWVMLQSWVLRPLDQLGRNLHQVADGYYTHRIQLRAPPEIDRVGRDVESMRERIVSDLDEVAQARRTLQEQSDVLQRQAEELQRSNQELEQFAYVASHDLQEPLRKVASFCQLLQRRYRGQLDERADSYIDFAVEGAKRMQTLISDLLAFSRVGRTRNFTEVDLDEALREALQSLASAVEETDASVTADELPTITGDPTLLRQVLFNLIGNAFKFRGEQAPRVHIGVTERSEEWVFSCTDNGIGIDAQYAQRVFVLFQRLHSREKYGGTGIGLSMCKKIVEFHGGRMWVDTEWLETPDADGTRICWSVPKSTAPTEPDSHVRTAHVG